MVISAPYLIEAASIPSHKLSSVLRVNGLLWCLSAHRGAAAIGRHGRIHKTHYRTIQLLKPVSQQHTIYQLLPFLDISSCRVQQPRGIPKNLCFHKNLNSEQIPESKLRRCTMTGCRDLVRSSRLLIRIMVGLCNNLLVGLSSEYRMILNR